MDWLGEQEPMVQLLIIVAFAAALTAIIAAVGTTVRSYFRHSFSNRVESKQVERAREDTLREYAEPLAEAASELWWSMRGLFDLDSALASTETLDRPRNQAANLTMQHHIASLFGWMTALDRELRLMDGNSTVSRMRTTIRRVEEAFAGGEHPDLERVRSMLAVWRLQDPAPEGLTRDVGLILEGHLDRASVPVASDLSPDQKLALAVEIAEIVTSKTAAAVPASVIQETREQLADVLSRREVWIYPEWQSAIGDVMVTEFASAPRRFDVKGLREFWQMLMETDEGGTPWFTALAELAQSINVEGDPHREPWLQYHSIGMSLAKLILEVHITEPDRSVTRQRTREAARQVVRQTAGTDHEN